MGAVIITGAGLGIGYAIAEALAQQGYEVIICSRNHKHLREARDRLCDLRSGSAYDVVLDISDKQAVDREFEAIFGSHDNVMGLVNNAAILKPSPFLSDPDFWVSTINTNLLGTYFTSYAFIKNLTQYQGRKIINIASTLAHTGRAGFSAYCSSKHAVLGFTRALALEYLEHGLIVNSISPGWVETAMALNDLKVRSKALGMDIASYRRMVEEQIPIKRFLKPTEVADMALYLFQNQSIAISGQDFSINGGEILT